MKPISPAHLILPNLPRRRFIQGLAAGGVLLGLSPWVGSASAREMAATALGSAKVLTGTEFDLTIAETPVNFTGAPRMATTVNGSLPAPTLRWREGDTVTLRVTNRLAEETSIHWHGILLPFQMDGVPGISFKGIAPGETFIYRFKVQQTGTYWYHSHSGMQEQTGVYGAIIIDPAGGDPIRADRDYVVQLSDWSDEDPMRVFDKLKMQGDYYNFNQPTAVDFFRDVSRDGLKSALAKRKMWNEMRMSPTDLADVSADTYTYLMNGTTPAGNWTGLFRPGERVRLRFINSGAMSFFDVRIPGLKMTVVQTDGQDVEPVTVDEIRIGVAETYDVHRHAQGRRLHDLCPIDGPQRLCARHPGAACRHDRGRSRAGQTRTAHHGRHDGRYGWRHGRHESRRYGGHGSQQHGRYESRRYGHGPQHARWHGDGSQHAWRYGYG